MAGFLFRLETVDGEPAEPPTLSSAVPDWKPGHTIHIGKRTLRVLGSRDDDGDQPPVLVVEEASLNAGQLLLSDCRRGRERDGCVVPHGRDVAPVPQEPPST